MSHRLRACTGALLLAASAAWGQAPPAPQDFVITGADIELGNGQMISGGAVAVRGGAIAYVGPASGAPSGLTAIDGTGKRVYPGFIDGFISGGLKLPEDVSESRPGVVETAPATMWTGNRKGLEADWVAAENLQLTRSVMDHRNGVTAGLMGSTRGGLRGWMSLVEMLEEGDGRILNAQAAAGVSFRRAAGQGYPTNILGVIAQIRQSFADAAGLAKGIDFDPAMPADAPARKSLAALAPAFNGKFTAFEANQSREIERALDIAAEFGLKPMIIGGRDAAEMVDRLKAEDVPVVLTAELGRAPDREPRAGSTTPQPVLEERYAQWEKSAKGDQVLAAAGVRILFSARGSVQSLLASVRERIERGLSREAALKGLTSGAAQALGESRIGSLTVGSRANIVLMSGDFADEDSTVERVWIQGRPVLAPTGGTR
jgi:imidazolonepropionase-like amidohydrolase